MLTAAEVAQADALTAELLLIGASPHGAHVLATAFVTDQPPVVRAWLLGLLQGHRRAPAAALAATEGDLHDDGAA